MTCDVVFIDDEPDLCELYSEFFSSENINVHTFTEPMEALNFLSDREIACCFIDYRMPGINGIDLRARIGNHIDCYLITGELDLGCPEHFAGLLTKPINFVQLQQLLEDIASKHQS
ncbi:response regulator [Aestuariibacter salexigens]|uniref:response regulator n=1 Tax=Aestuariibacter salexigens TaxID=226010 RepID=UPI000409D7B9|nr:response regulator [Aestuariibacter salexigens]